MKAFWTRTILAPLYDLGQQALASLSSLVGMLVLIMFGLILGWIAKEIIIASCGLYVSTGCAIG